MPQYRSERNYENVNKALYEGAGPYGIPKLDPVQCRTENWISFNYAKTCTDAEGHGVHFFIDDYQFQRLWSNPDGYLAMLKKFEAVMTPDFSTYTDFPKAIQIYNHYRKHWLGAYRNYDQESAGHAEQSSERQDRLYTRLYVGVGQQIHECL